MKGSNPLTDITYTESQEQIMDDIKLQDTKAYVQPDAKDVKRSQRGIVVSNEFNLTVDPSNANHTSVA